MRSKESRYRLLLELYPGDFRREYADEMVGVLMADPRPVRKHAASLMAGAVAARLRATLDGSEWRRAAFVVQLFGAILLCAVALRRLAMAGALALFEPSYNVPPLDVLDVVRVVAWAAVVVATLTGLRGVSIAAGLAGLIGEIAAPSSSYSDAPVVFLNVFWIVMSAAVVVTASTAAVRGPRPRGWMLVVIAGVLLVGNGFGTPTYYWYGGTGPWAPHALVLAAGVFALAGVIRLEPAIRRRVVACWVPVATVFPLISYGFGGFLDFNLRHPGDIQLLGPVQWAALVLIPAFAFWIAAGLNLRLERSREAAGATNPAGGATDWAAGATGSVGGATGSVGGAADTTGGTAVSASGATEM
jgi:hypothetical protein